METPNKLKANPKRLKWQWVAKNPIFGQLQQFVGMFGVELVVEFDENKTAKDVYFQHKASPTNA